MNIKIKSTCYALIKNILQYVCLHFENDAKKRSEKEAKKKRKMKRKMKRKFKKITIFSLCDKHGCE